MEVIIKVGGVEKLLRGGEISFEVCELRNIRPEKGAEPVATWVPVKWFADLVPALNYFLREKVKASDARTLEEVKSAIEQAKRELCEYYGMGIG